MIALSKNNRIEPPQSRVMVVDDDFISRSYLQMALGKSGYEVVTAEDAYDAEQKLTGGRLGGFDCIVTDYRMPERSGLDLLAWVQEQDASLATIVITAEGEKQLVAESLRGGAADFLDKPVTLEELHATVARAVKRTQRQRRLAQTERAAQGLGNVQQRMLGLGAAKSPLRLNVCFHPMHEAGGDFFNHFQPSPDNFFCLLTDVSGHDLQAAYISSHFQGVVRGMWEQAASMEETFSTFNRLLIEEWNQARTSGGNKTGIGASVAACAVLIDSSSRTSKVLVHGTPPPVYWEADGEARVIGDAGGIPLGWFPDFVPRGAVQTISTGGAFCLWTDGLEDLASRNGVTELSMAYALQKAKAKGFRLEAINTAKDDILVVDIQLSIESPGTGEFRPLIMENYHGAQSPEIDEIQSNWKRSLMFAIPELPLQKLHDILLASREAVLNAMQHGCNGRADLRAQFQIACCESSNTVRVRVFDPGDGHSFDVDKYETPAADDLLPEHRGLILVKHLTNSLQTGRNGASLIMDFIWP